MKVRSIMSSPVVSVGPEASVGTIARLLVDNDIHGLPVLDENGAVVGVVTESDLIIRNANLHFPRFIQILDARIYVENTRHFDEEVKKMLAATAGDLMTSPAIVVYPEDDIEEAATLMVEKHIHTLPVVEEGQLVGIISRSDLVRLMVEDAAASTSNE